MINYRNAVLQVSAVQLGPDWVQKHAASMAAEAARSALPASPPPDPGGSYKAGLIAAGVIMVALAASHVARRA